LTVYKIVFVKGLFIYIRAKREDEIAVIEIEETGQGISLIEQAKKFQPFYTTKEDRTGLGLSICQELHRTRWKFGYLKC
jgi:signal transduction histidine kinase